MINLIGRKESIFYIKISGMVESAGLVISGVYHAHDNLKVEL